MFVIEKEISFEAGHRLMNYEGKCRWIHGHNYIARIGLASEKLDERGMVEDFSEIKEKIKEFIDEKIDHGMIFCMNDTEWIKIFQEKKQKVYVIPDNPTAEALASHFYHTFKTDFPQLKYVEVQETPTSNAVFRS